MKPVTFVCFAAVLAGVAAAAVCVASEDVPAPPPATDSPPAAPPADTPSPAAASSPTAPDAADATDAPTEKTPATPEPAATGEMPEGAAPVTPEAREEARKMRREILRLQAALRARRTALKVEQAAATDVLQMLGERGRFSVVYDPALAASDIDLTRRCVTLSFAGLTYEEALMLVLPPECGYQVGAGYVLVTTLEKSWQPLRTATYRIQPILAQPPNFVAPRMSLTDLSWASAQGGGGPFAGGAAAEAEPDPNATTPDRVIEVIKQFVRSEDDRRIAPWDDAGGPASIQYLKGTLIVSQTEAGHAAVARLLVMIH